eukprot:g47324.t1
MVASLPPKTTANLEPLDQEMIRNLKKQLQLIPQVIVENPTVHCSRHIQEACKVTTEATISSRYSHAGSKQAVTVQDTAHEKVQ